MMYNELERKMNNMISEKNVKKFCNGDISKIENYDKAITDMEHTWDCHHRLETGNNGERISRKDLISHGLYYNRPTEELIFLTKSEHRRLHHNGNKKPPFSSEHRRKLSESHKCKTPPNKGIPMSLEQKMKLSEANKGKHLSEDTKMKISSSLKGKPKSEETCMRISEAKKAYWAKRKMTGN